MDFNILLKKYAGFPQAEHLKNPPIFPAVFLNLSVAYLLQVTSPSLCVSTLPVFSFAEHHHPLLSPPPIPIYSSSVHSAQLSSWSNLTPVDSQTHAYRPPSSLAVPSRSLRFRTLLETIAARRVQCKLNKALISCMYVPFPTCPSRILKTTARTLISRPSVAVHPSPSITCRCRLTDAHCADATAINKVSDIVLSFLSLIRSPP
ncbi:hypothetical protein OF83DRAFT_1147891 [Amylostereum chailletii]|nr:hypothetical protein OF83DRAFT_1147891 [Amylostereum chailletii]